MSHTPKNIIICCDGTGNQFGDTNSNVVRLYTCLEVNEHQVAYYHPGVGTMGDPNRTWRIAKEWSRLKGLAFGHGFTDNLADAYRYLMNTYVTGDRIYLFGFSRGAYTVRALAGALSVYGLLCAGNEGHLNYLLQMLRKESRDAYSRRRGSGPRQFQESAQSRAFRETFSRQVPIHFLGVWDTVSSIGWIYDPVKILYDGQNAIIRKGRHAISVDERRCFYQAVPWGKPLSLTSEQMDPEDLQRLKLALAPDQTSQNIVQAWFPGAHSDVGGSYKLCDSAPAIEAFKWMLREAEEDNVAIQPAKKEAILGRNSTFEGILKWNTPLPEKNNCIHESLRGAWWILEFFPHKYFDEQGKKRWRFTPWPHRREIPDRALMHPELRARLDDKTLNYHPKNLDPNRIRDFTLDDGSDYHADAAQRLTSERFGLYQAKKPGGMPPPLAAAACLCIGAGIFLLNRFRTGGYLH